MRGFLIAIAALTIVAVYGLWVNGSGGLKRLVTISGIYAVERPQGWPVVCFVNRASGDLQCLPLKELLPQEAGP